MNTGRIMKQPPGGQCHDLFGAEFKGSPCHHRVLKPPGGASSDIFGRPDEVDQSPRKIRSNHHLKSSVFGTHSTPEPPATSRSKPGNDTHNRLFGPLENRPQSASLNRMKSNIPVGVVGAGSELGQSSSSTSSKSVPIENGQQEMLSTPKDGNPVTGEGYSAVANGEKESSSTQPAATTTNGTGSAEIRRNRVPPGGYSSGLW
ncbi:microtubule-associated protein Jupiter isoform X5 [Cryptotermes secundus]|uniref:microtubule-associated protein Jupiter isoform X5 n=1 Tax=Cryptotermes secundus TaxID=105785 RepID=UPI000CD7B85C|nr:microtubule-associated protein Jupiter isoform X5 [Cryptotermes secundus]